MSRTDKTKPAWVRHREHGGLPLHDHRHGSCDLPPLPTRENTGTRCRWAGVTGMASPWTCCARTQERSAYKEWQEWVKAANRKLRREGRDIARGWHPDTD
ncbi:hypothetical protein [Lentzea sp.]|uniref:hypothetical protein n=1 Tax=Lentzea sp. TaxID=56099 RepID=UPI002ED1F0E9